MNYCILIIILLQYLVQDIAHIQALFVTAYRDISGTILRNIYCNAQCICLIPYCLIIVEVMIDIMTSILIQSLLCSWLHLRKGVAMMRRTMQQFNFKFRGTTSKNHLNQHKITTFFCFTFISLVNFSYSSKGTYWLCQS